MWGALAGAAVMAVGGLIAGEQQRGAVRRASRSQEKMTREALAEEQRQFDTQMEEYRRKQALLERQQAQVTQQLAPYQQAGQSALFQMLALSGIAAPPPVVPAGLIDPTGTPQQQQQQSALAQRLAAENEFGITFGEQAAAELDKGGRSLSAEEWRGIDPTASPRAAAANMYQQVAQVMPNASTQDIMDETRRRLTTMQPETQMPTVPNVESPYAGMTGEQAQTMAIENIAQSPLLKELTRQGEEAILQQSAATGGLRGGNIQAALAQFRPQMLQNEIDKQYQRLAGLSGTGLSATTATPMINAGPVPINPNIGQYYSDIGAIRGGSAMAQGQITANQIGNIARGIGYGVGSYMNRPPETDNPGGGQGGT